MNIVGLGRGIPLITFSRRGPDPAWLSGPTCSLQAFADKASLQPLSTLNVNPK